MEDKIPSHRTEITDDLDKLLQIFPTEIRSAIEQHSKKDSLIEVVMDLWKTSRRLVFLRKFAI